MVTINQEVKNKRLKDKEAEIDKRIQAAIKNGSNRTYFACDKDIDANIYSEMVSLYTKNGYKIISTGFSGGVWQLSEDIVW